MAAGGVASAMLSLIVPLYEATVFQERNEHSLMKDFRAGIARLPQQFKDRGKSQTRALAERNRTYCRKPPAVLWGAGAMEIIPEVN